MKPICVAIVFLLSTIISGYCADFYVSTAGSDSNPGTQAQPFATIQHAIDACPYTLGSSTVHLDGSTWNESPTLNATWHWSQPCRPNLTVIGDYNGPNGQGGRNTTHIFGKFTVWSYLNYQPGMGGCSATLTKLTVKSIQASTSASTPNPECQAYVYISDCNVQDSDTRGIECSSTCGAIYITNCDISNSAQDGIYAYLFTTIEDCNITSNGQNGIYYYHGQLYAVVDNNTIQQNAANGIVLDAGAIMVKNNNIEQNNGYGVYVIGGLSTWAIPDLGGGSLDSPGNNTISGNGTYEVYNDSPNLIFAKYNYWDPLSSAEMAGHTYLEVNITRIFDYWDDDSKGYVNWDEPGIPTRVSHKSLGEIRASFYPSSNTIGHTKVR